MADQAAVAEFKVRFTDEVSGGVESAAGALEQLRRQMQADQRELANLQRAMKNLQGSMVVDLDAAKKLRAAIEAKKHSIAEAQAAYVNLGGDINQTGRSVLSFKERMASMMQQVNTAPGPLGRVSTQLTQFGQKVTGAQLRLVALVAGFTAATVAAGSFLRTLAKDAVVAQDAARSELLHFHALTKVRNLWGLAAGKAADMQAAVNQVSASVSIGRDQVAGYAEQLYRAGLRGDNLKLALEGASIKASALGSSAGAEFAGFAQTVALTGGSVKRLAEDVRNRFGGIVAQQMNSLEVSARKSQEAYASLFSGLHVEPVLQSLTRLRTIFAANTEAGRVMKQVLTFLLQPLLNAATATMNFMRRFFKQMLIGVGELLLAYVAVRDKFREAFGSPQQQKQMQSLLDKVDLGRYAVFALAGMFGYAGLRLTSMLLGPVLTLIGRLSTMALTIFTRVLPAMWSFLTATLRNAAALESRLIPIMTAQVGPALRSMAAQLLGLARQGLAAASQAFLTLSSRLFTTATAGRAALIPSLQAGLVSLRAFAASAWAAAAPLLYTVGVVALAGLALWGLYKVGELVWTFFKEIDWSEGIGAGLLLGIKGLGFAVMEAFKELGGIAVKAFKTVLGIASPSKVFAELGATIPEGVAKGVTTAAPTAQAAVDGMIAPRVQPVAPEAQAAAGAAPATGGKAQVTIQELHVHTASDKPKDVAQALRRELETVLEGLALQLGTRPLGERA